MLHSQSLHRLAFGREADVCFSSLIEKGGKSILEELGMSAHYGQPCFAHAIL